MKLKDRAAWITGAAQGIGKAIAELFSQEGAKLLLTDVDAKLVEQTAQEISQKHGECLGVAADVTKLADCEAASREIFSSSSGENPKSRLLNTK